MVLVWHLAIQNSLPSSAELLFFLQHFLFTQQPYSYFQNRRWKFKAWEYSWSFLKELETSFLWWKILFHLNLIPRLLKWISFLSAVANQLNFEDGLKQSSTWRYNFSSCFFCLMHFSANHSWSILEGSLRKKWVLTQDGREIWATLKGN